MEYPPLYQEQKRMETIRHTLHKYPELAYEEHLTKTTICNELDSLGIRYVTGYGKTGVRAELGDNASGVCVALRADMDALPVTEQTGLEFSSTYPGKMHACGHDGHVAMLLGAARLLSKNKIHGQVILLFQPAEESGNGAAAMIADNCLHDVDMIFGGHIDTHFPPGVLTVDRGLICSYVDPFTIEIQGLGGHAAKPHEAVDAIIAAANLIMSIQTLVSRRINPTQPAVVTVGKISAGTTHNVIAEKAVLEGTIRSGHPATRKQLLKELERIIDGVGKMHNAQVRLQLHAGLPAVINDNLSTSIAHRAAVEVAGQEQVISQGSPSLGGEDFAFYQQKIPGCMIRFGARKTAGAGPAHSSTFDFDEAVFSYGARWLTTSALLALEELSHQ